jgi:hypothetical protein
VVTIGSDNAILGFTGSYQAGADRFLADVKVQETTNFSLLVELGRAFFYAPD